MKNFIELHDRAGRAMLVNTDHITKVFKDEDGIPTVELLTYYIETKESYEEIEELIRGAGVCIDKGDPRLDTKSPLTMEDLKHMVGEPVWNSNKREWELVKEVIDGGFTLCDYKGWYSGYEEDELIKFPLYRMKQ